MVEFFKGLVFYFLPLGFGGKRIEFFEREVRKRGGIVGSKKDRVTHVVVNESTGNDTEACVSALKNCGFKGGKKGAKCVNVSWLTECLSRKRLLETEPYEIEWPGKKEENEEEEQEDKAKRTNNGRDGEGKGYSSKKEKIDYEDYVCSLPSSSSSCARSSEISSGNNKLILRELEKLANAYAVRNDKWRSHAYKKAINAVAMHGKEIKTFWEARNIPGIGEKMALKIMEIVECGKLGKVEEVVDEKTRILEAFCLVWGAGPSTAEAWYAQGCRSLEDVLMKGKLTRQQEIGLKRYEDLVERIPREEMEEIFEVIQREAVKISESLELELVGSYRRGKLSCGDVDVMIVNRGSKTPGDILIQLTDALRLQGYLTDDLINLETPEPENLNFHRKYFGIFKLSGEKRRHRRLDLFVVPKEEKALALFHYTGSALFNRNVKLWAMKKGMTLTEHGLYAETLRTGSEVASKGQLISIHEEKDIFEALGLPFKVPEERDH